MTFLRATARLGEGTEGHGRPRQDSLEISHGPQYETHILLKALKASTKPRQIYRKTSSLHWYEIIHLGSN
jgi:hypothetical protein